MLSETLQAANTANLVLGQQVVAEVGCEHDGSLQRITAKLVTLQERPDPQGGVLAEAILMDDKVIYITALSRVGHVPPPAPVAPAAPVKTVQVLRFEMVPCGRCMGTGHHSYNTRTGSVCFDCKGGKQVLSRLGRAARKAYDIEIAKRAMVDLSDLKEGDLVYTTNDDAWMSRRQGWVTVLSVTANELNPGRLTLKTSKGPGLIADPTYRMRINRPEVTAQIMQEIARRFKGASLVDKEA